MKPQVTQKISGYEVVFGEVVAKVTSVHVHSDGHVSANLGLFYSQDKKATKIFNQANLNLESSITMDKHAKHQGEKFPHIKADWTEIFDYLSNNIPEWARQGDEAIEVWAEDDLPAPEKMMNSIIYKGVQNIIFGDKGVNKSTLSYAICAGLTLPSFQRSEFLGIDLPSKAQTALVLDWETNESIFRFYVSRLKKGMGLPSFPIFYRRCHLSLSQDIEAIGQFVDNTKTDLLLIDSLGAAAGGENAELKGSESPLAFNSALRKLGKTSLIIGQTSKDESNRKSIYGSTFFRYYARNIFELCKSDDEGEDEHHLALFHRDCNFGRKVPPMGFSVCYDEGQNTIKLERESVSVAEFREKVSNNLRILELLKDGAMTAKEIARELETSESNIRGACKRLRDSQKIVKTGEGKWGLLL